MRSTVCLAAIIAAALVGPLSAQPQQAGRAAAPGGSDTVQASVRASADRLEIVFPPLSPANAGCFASPLQDGRRPYSWGVDHYFPGSRMNNAHLMRISLLFSLPARDSITAQRLDSAIGATRLEIYEARGEPPMIVRRLSPKRATVRRRDGAIHVLIQDSTAVEAFLRPGADSVYVQWCQRDRVRSGWRPIVR